MLVLEVVGREHPEARVAAGRVVEALDVFEDRLGELGAGRPTLAVEELGRRRMVVVPFIEPGTAGGATLTQKGLRWLLDHEGGKPADQPTALKLARKRVRAEDEAARLPRAQVYGASRRP